MPDNSFQYELLTSQGQVSSGTALYADLPGEEGRLGILAGHQPAIIGLAAGLLRIQVSASSILEWSVNRGVATITPERVLILTRDATPSHSGVHTHLDYHP